MCKALVPHTQPALGLGANAELLVGEEVIPWAAGAGAAGGDCVGDPGRSTTPVCNSLTAGFDDEIDSTGAENVIEVHDGGGFGTVEEGVVTSYNVRALFDAGISVDLEKFLHTGVVLSVSG